MKAATKPYSESCEQNRDPILSVLKDVFSKVNKVLEIGSGTGQHAVYFGRHLPHLIWEPSDVEENIPGIRLWLEEAQLANVLSPIVLHVTDTQWPEEVFDGIFSANTAHIMSWSSVEAMFNGIERVLESGGLFCLYGPFNYHGNYTSESNARFDQWLKMRDPNSGIRDFEALDKIAAEAGMTLDHDYEMPVNNRILVWRKR